MLTSLSLTSTFIAQDNSGQDLGGSLQNIGGYNPGSAGGAAGTSLNLLFSNLFGFLTITAGLMFLLYFFIGGYSWISAGGNADKVEKAQKTMTDAAIGLIVVVATYSIAFIVGRVLGFELLNPGSEIQKLMPGSAK